MLNRYTRPRVWLGILMLLTVFACQKDLEVDNSDKKFPISLRAKPMGDDYRFSWDIANHSGFTNYILLRSTEPVPAGIVPTNTGIASIVMNSDSIGKTSFTDASIPLAQAFYYKLYVGFDGRFVESDNVKITFNNFLVPGIASFVRFIPDSNWVVIGDEFNSRLMTLDYEDQRTINIVGTPPLTSSSTTAVVFDDGKPRLLVWPFNALSTYSYSLPLLSLGQEFNMQYSGFSLASNQSNGMVFSTHYDYNNALTIRRADNLSIISTYYRSEYYNQRILSVLKPADNILVEVSSTTLRKYQVHPTNGVILNNLEVSNPNTIFSPFLDIPVSPDGQFFAPYPSGEIYTQNLMVAGKLLANSSGQFVDIAFSPDGQFVYAVSNDFQFGGGALLSKWSLSDLSLLNQKLISGVNPRSIEAVDGGVVFVGTVNISGLSQTLVKKYTL